MFAAALWSERGTEEALVAAPADRGATRGVMTAHADTMRAQGERLCQTAAGSASPHRDHWMSDARWMIGDAAQLDATATLIDSQARLLGEHPGRSARSIAADAAALRDAADLLIDAGVRTRGVGALLQRVRDQVMRSLGR